MKKIRNIPYGYSYENGRIVINDSEAEIVRDIFERYTSGESLGNIADYLTEQHVPYTEKSLVWDKAKIHRMIEDQRYSGDKLYEPIIDSAAWESALGIKRDRLGRSERDLCDEVAFLKGRIKCGICGSTMCRRVSRQKKLESWTCYNDDCRLHVRISDKELIKRVSQLMRQIVDDADSYLPAENGNYIDSPEMIKLKNDYLEETDRLRPDEDKIIGIICAIASIEYDALNTDKIIEFRRFKNKLAEYADISGFSKEMINDIIDRFTVGSDFTLTAHTKYGIEITERRENG